VKEESEPHRLAVDARDYHFRSRSFGEKSCTKLFFRGNAGFTKPLVRREAFDELQNERDIVLIRLSHFNRIRQSPGPR